MWAPPLKPFWFLSDKRCRCDFGELETYVGHSPVSSHLALTMSRTFQDEDVTFDNRVEYHMSEGRNLRRADRFIGLRFTGQIRSLLQHRPVGRPGTCQQLLNPTLHRSPYPVVFPFLLAEAKSATAQETFAAVYEEMAPTIEQSMSIQDNAYREFAA